MDGDFRNFAFLRVPQVLRCLCVRADEGERPRAIYVPVRLGLFFFLLIEISRGYFFPRPADRNHGRVPTVRSGKTGGPEA